MHKKLGGVPEIKNIQIELYDDKSSYTQSIARALKHERAIITD